MRRKHEQLVSSSFLARIVLAPSNPLVPLLALLLVVNGPTIGLLGSDDDDDDGDD